MPATENLKFEVELKMSGSSDFVKQLKTQLEEVNKAVKTVENNLKSGLGNSLDELIKKAQELSNLLSGVSGGNGRNGSSKGIVLNIDLTPLTTVLTRVETQLNTSFQTTNSRLQQSIQNSVLVLEQVKLVRTKLYEIGSKFGVSAVSAGSISSSAIPVNPGNSSNANTVIVRESSIEPLKIEPIDVNVSCQCNCGNNNSLTIDPNSKKPILPSKKSKGPKPTEPNPVTKSSNTSDPDPKNSNPTVNIEYLEKISGYLAAFSASVFTLGVYSASAYDKTVDLKESLYAVTLSASQTQSALETVSKQQIVSGYTTEHLKDATILLERMGASAKRYLPIAVNVAQKTGNKLAVVAEDLAGALNSLEALEAFQNKYNISNHDLERNGAHFQDGNIKYDYASDQSAASEALSKALEQSFTNDNNVNTYGEAVNNLQNSIEALAAKVGEQLLPAFIALASAGTSAINWLESFDSGVISSVSGIVAFTGAVSGIIPVVSRLLPMLKALPAALVSLGPYGWAAAGLVAIAGYGIGKASSETQQSLKELEAVRQESSELTKIVQLAREFAEQKEIALKHGLSQVEVENKLGDELSNNVKKLEEIQGNIDAIKKKRSRFLGDYTDYDDLEKAYSDTESQLKDKDKEYGGLKEKLKTAHSKRTRLPITYQIGMVEKERNSLQAKLDDLDHRKKMVKFYDNTLSKIEPYVDNAQKKIDTLSVLEKDVERMKKAVSTAESSGGDRTGHYIRAIISEESLAPLRNAIVNNYERYLRKPGETRSDAYRNLTNREFISEMLFSLSKEGKTDSPLFKELQMLSDLLKKRDATYANVPSDFEKAVEKLNKAVSVAESSGGDKADQYVREIISEKALAPLRKSLIKNYGEELRKPGEDNNQAYKNLTDRNFISNMLVSLSQEGKTDSTLFKELQMLFDLLKKRDAASPQKDLETVLRELKESKGWQSSEETKQKRSGFTAEKRINPEEWKDLGRQLEQASRDNRAYLQTHKEDLEKFSQAMDAWADKQMDIWETWAQAQLKGHDAAWAKTPEQRLDVSKQTLHYYSELLKSHKDLLSQNEKLNDRLTNAIKEQAEAYSQALQERFEKESAGKTEDEILKAARRNLQSARSAKDLPEEMRVQEINKWKEHIQEALDSIQEKREEQQEKLRSMETEKQNKQLEELEKRREKGEDVWPQMLALMRQMAAAEIEQVKLAEQKEIDALPEDLRDTQRELAEWHIAQTREKWQQQILEAYKRGNTKDTKSLDKRKKEIDQTTAAKNAKEDEAVRRERERISRPTTFRSYDEIKQYKDNQRLEALQKKADERKAKNTEQANAEKQRLEEEARQKELESEKALTDSLGNLDVSIKALTEAMISQSSMSGNKEGSSSSFLKDGKKETAGADAGGGSSAAEGTGTETVSDKFRMALPYATAALSHAGQIYLSTGQEPIINPRMLEPLNQARELQERMARQVSSTVNNSTTSSTLQNFYIDGSKRAGDPDLRSLADSVSKILERRERRQRAYSGMW